MKVDCIIGRGYDCNIYIVKGEKTTIIDCGTGLNEKFVVNEISKITEPLKISQIILTHEHFDHTGGLKGIYDMTQGKAKIFAHENASKKIEKGESHFAKLLGGNMPKMPVDIKLKDSDSIKIGDYDFKVFHTPGHTQGSICLYNAEKEVLFTGDTVFAYGSFGRTDLEGGSMKKLKESIERLSKLEVSDLYPGHENFVKNDGKRHLMLSLKNVQNMLF